VTARLPISACLISGPEKARIGRALASIAEWTEEIHVVLNHDVADGTDEIARSYGAIVHREVWRGHVAQKNAALDKATRPWVLGLDADEVVSDELRASIERLFRDPSRPPGHAAYRFPRATDFYGRFLRHGDWYPDYQTRLWRRGSARWAGQNPHDKLKVDGTIGRLKGDLLHYPAETLDDQIRKIHSYTDGFVADRVARGAPTGWRKMLVSPWWCFLRGYLVKGGFLDGWRGYYVARMNAFTALTRYTKMKALAEKRRRSPDDAP
jgi:glycosyltransferase involved in cell wall biosynthesis